nr:Chain E, Histone H4 [Saccharomyces cerevisiae S288C]6RXQ_F Chain F, Histone H4 [Saccharomyces cerevisiae S288C]6RXQ_G Chain G, Histone H4 [Saccharomyces cerevisiae S288C]6RXQ_H Chain H, Histone H4 [Saccharomyces cerevisiae S288C]6RXR_E Chain E, Histone H4 [Saccharomyces cerevisiae S288C]6RXR_F Chain F, Histone H4 [Saccharomyces cerevisiae S288C]6RXR_G Chain G, Histone H4 [Saccharomyces cerevisiae S288C]6RXR_H Chain H, Histone H4 [Saccharomyces cerevisiae S288C]
KGGAKRHRKIL